MKRENISQALSLIDQRYLLEALALEAPKPAPAAPKEDSMKRSRHGAKTARRTLLIAAVIASLMTVTAVAADFYGIRTITREDSHQQLPMATTLPDGSVETTMTPVMELGGTRPYDGPDWAMEWVNTAKSAFAEWRAYKDERTAQRERVRAENTPQLTAFNEKYADAGYHFYETQDNGDGTSTCIKGRMVEDPEKLVPNIWGEMVPGVKDVLDYDTATVISNEELDYERSYCEQVAKLGGYGDYHHIYAVWDEEEAAKLEEIAAKYDLILRDGENTVFGGEGIDNIALNRQLSDAVGTGLIYREAPVFDHYSTFASGSFQSMASIPLADGRKASTYICSTAYHEMVDGGEVGGLTVREDVPMVTRSHTAPDGTELTISQNDTQAVIYAYLDSAYITITVTIDNWVAPGVTETDFQLSEDIVNYVADFINYKNIGK